MRKGFAKSARERAARLKGAALQGGLLLGAMGLAAAAVARPSTATAVLASAACALAVSANWAAAARLTRRLDPLRLAIEGLERGPDGPMAIEGPDEAGRLGQAFNRMALEVRAREQAVARVAFLDSATGLGALPALERDVAEAVRRGGRGSYVLALGLDRFGRLRDAIGVDRADAVVREAGARLAGAVSDATVCRLAPDLLAIVLSAEDGAAAEHAALVAIGALETPLHLGPDTISVTFSAGLASAEGQSAVGDARAALDRARAERRRIVRFEADASGDPSANLALMSGMLWAIRSGEVELFYQPRFDLRRRKVNAVEGLVRWRHPTRGLLRPDVFIPLAESTGHIRILTDWVVRQAVADQAALRRLGHDIAVSINLSGRVLGDEAFAEVVDRTMKEAVGPISFEITEAAVLEDPDRALAQLDRYRRAGVSITVDDYGAGPSSLARLRQIGGETLKIDESLIAGVAENQRDALIVRSAIDLAHGLGMTVTAEGVETAGAFQLLTAMGCDAVQGYLIAKPQPLNELLIFLREDGENRGYG